MKQRAGLDLGQRGAAETERPADRDRELADRVRMLARVAVAGAQRDRKGPHDGAVRFGSAIALFTDAGKRSEECLLALEEAAGSVERLPAKIVEQAWIAHTTVIGTRGSGD